jgi:hypothetical protein
MDSKDTIPIHDTSENEILNSYRFLIIPNRPEKVKVSPADGHKMIGFGSMKKVLPDAAGPKFRYEPETGKDLILTDGHVTP